MAYDRATRQRVRAKFVQGMALTSAAMAEDVPYNTARRWKADDSIRGDDWDLERNARRMSRSGVHNLANEVLNELATQFLATLEVLKQDKQLPADKRAQILVQLMDGYHKAIHARARAMPEANQLAVAMDVVKFLTTHIAARAPALREQWMTLIEGAGDAMLAEFGQGGA
jgi:hypothetical protein